MNKKFYFLFLIIISLLFLFYISNKKETKRVLDVIKADKIYIDFNSNNKKDDDELCYLMGAKAFPQKFNKEVFEYLENKDLKVDEILKLGYFGVDFTKNKLLNKEITLKERVYKGKNQICLVNIQLNGEDFAKTLIENGFAYPYNVNSNIFYDEYFKIENIKNTLNKLKSEDLRLVDNENKAFYNLSCFHDVKIKNVEILKRSEIDKSYSEIKTCDRYFEKPKDEPVVVEKNIPNFENKNIKIYYVNPVKYQKPSNKTRTSAGVELIKIINNAKESIDFALYGYQNQQDILNALINAKKRGVKIRGVVDSNKKGEYTYPDTPVLSKYFDITTEKTNHLMHNKFFIIDKSIVYTGSMNISPTGTGGYNSNLVVEIKNKIVADFYTKEFEEMFNNKFQKFKKQFDFETLKMPDGVEISVYFTPDDKIYEKAIKKYIQNAKSKIYVSAFYLTNFDLAADLVLKKRQNVDVKVILDATGVINKSAKLKYLRENNISVKVENWGGKNHEKTILADDVLIFGSANFTNSAFYQNDENIIVIKNLKVANFYQKNFLNIFNSIDNKYLTKIPRAEGFESKNSCFDNIDNDYDGKIDKMDEGCKYTKK